MYNSVISFHDSILKFPFSKLEDNLRIVVGNFNQALSIRLTTVNLTDVHASLTRVSPNLGGVNTKLRELLFLKLCVHFNKCPLFAFVRTCFFKKR